ncbi:hypothetical protein EDD86DRAFT_213138 [Gorgonomyces haynaldii]|nr:hypothetical protein EDD86DRAFT_213138 [Gorgonomyces haynaldii]
MLVTLEQRKSLQMMFWKNPHPSVEQLRKISSRCGIPVHELYQWFHIMRTRHLISNVPVMYPMPRPPLSFVGKRSQIMGAKPVNIYIDQSNPYSSGQRRSSFSHPIPKKPNLERRLSEQLEYSEEQLLDAMNLVQPERSHSPWDWERMQSFQENKRPRLDLSVEDLDF